MSTGAELGLGKVSDEFKSLDKQLNATIKKTDELSSAVNGNITKPMSQIDLSSVVGDFEKLNHQFDVTINKLCEFSSALNNSLVKPVSDSVAKVEEMVSSLLRVSSSVPSTASNISKAFSKLNTPTSMQKGKDSTTPLKDLESMVTEFVRIGKIDVSKSFSNLSKSFANLGKGLNDLEKSVSSSQLRNIKGNMDELKETLTYVVQALGPIGSENKKLVPVGENQWKLVEDDLTKNFKGFQALMKVLKPLNSTFSADVVLIRDFGKKVVPQMKDSINKLIVELGGFGTEKGQPAVYKNSNGSFTVKTANEVASLMKGFSSLANSLSNFKGVFQSDSAQITAFSQNIPEMKKAIGQLISELGGFGSYTEAAVTNTKGTPVKFIKKYVDENMKGFAELASTLNQFANAVKSLNVKSVSGMLSSLQTLTDNLQVHLQNATKLVSTPDFASFERLANAMDKVASSARTLPSSTIQARKALEDVNTSAKKTHKIFGFLTPVVKQFFTAFVGYNIVYSVVRSIQAATKAMADMELGMARVNTIARVSKGTLAQWSAQVLKMSSGYGIEKSDLLKSLYDINSATITGAKAFYVLDAAARAARAGFTETSKTANLLSKIINAYGYAASDAGKLSDVLFRTVERGINPMEELSQYMGRVLTISANAGVGFNELAAAIATMTSHGLQTNIAVTALNSSILKLSQGNKNLNALFQKFGYETSAAAVRAEGFGYVLQKIKDETGGATDALTKLGFNYRDIRAMSVLTSDSLAVYTDNLRRMDDAAKEGTATQDALSKVQETLSYKWDVMKQSITNALVAFQQWAGSSTVLKGITDSVVSISRAFTNVFVGTTNASKALEFLTIAVMKAIKWFLIMKVLMFSFSRVGHIFASLGASVSAFSMKGVTLTNVLKLAKFEMFAFGATGTKSLKAFIVSMEAAKVSVRGLRIGLSLLKGVATFGASIAIDFGLQYLFEWLGKTNKGAEKLNDTMSSIKDPFNDIDKSLAKSRKGLDGLGKSIKDLSKKSSFDLAFVDVNALKDRLAEIKNEWRSNKVSSDVSGGRGSTELNEQLSLIKKYDKAIDILSNTVEKYKKQNGQFINVHRMASNVVASFTAYIDKGTTKLTDYLSAMTKAALAEEAFKKLGFDARGLLELGGDAFQKKIDELFKAGKISDDGRKALLNYKQAFEELKKSGKEGAKEVNNLAASLDYLIGKKDKKGSLDAFAFDFEKIATQFTQKSALSDTGIAIPTNFFSFNPESLRNATDKYKNSINGFMSTFQTSLSAVSGKASAIGVKGAYTSVINDTQKQLDKLIDIRKRFFKADEELVPASAAQRKKTLLKSVGLEDYSSLEDKIVEYENKIAFSEDQIKAAFSNIDLSQWKTLKEADLFKENPFAQSVFASFKEEFANFDFTDEKTLMEAFCTKFKKVMQDVARKADFNKALQDVLNLKIKGGVENEELAKKLFEKTTGIKATDTSIDIQKLIGADFYNIIGKGESRRFSYEKYVQDEDSAHGRVRYDGVSDKVYRSRNLFDYLDKISSSGVLNKISSMNQYVPNVSTVTTDSDAYIKFIKGNITTYGDLYRNALDQWKKGVPLEKIMQRDYNLFPEGSGDKGFNKYVSNIQSMFKAAEGYKKKADSITAKIDSWYDSFDVSTMSGAKKEKQIMLNYDEAKKALTDAMRSGGKIPVTDTLVNNFTNAANALKGLSKATYVPGEIRATQAVEYGTQEANNMIMKQAFAGEYSFNEKVVSGIGGVKGVLTEFKDFVKNKLDSNLNGLTIVRVGSKN